MTPSDFAAYPTGSRCNADARVRVVAPAVLAEVAHVAAREEAVRARIRAGETTLEIFELDP